MLKVREPFGLERVVLVGDRGLLTQGRIEHLKRHPGLGWVSALRAPQVRSLVESEALQLSLFDEQHLAEFVSPHYPGERLVGCYNPLPAEERACKREALLAATEAGLERIAREAARRTRTPLDAAHIGHKVGRVIARHKPAPEPHRGMAKHFRWAVREGRLVYARDHERIEAEARLDGLYVLRTSEPAQRLPPEDTVRTCKGLADVERWFRTLKGRDIRVRPIRHREERRVRAPLFLCLLAGYAGLRRCRSMLAGARHPGSIRHELHNPPALAGLAARTRPPLVMAGTRTRRPDERVRGPRDFNHGSSTQRAVPLGCMGGTGAYRSRRRMPRKFDRADATRGIRLLGLRQYPPGSALPARRFRPALEPGRPTSPLRRTRREPGWL